MKNNTNNIEMDSLTFKKMVFMYNALEDGWEIKKREKNYIFTKKHEGKKEVFLDNFLHRFIEKNFDMNNIL